MRERPSLDRQKSVVLFDFGATLAYREQVVSLRRPGKTAARIAVPPGRIPWDGPEKSAPGRWQLRTGRSATLRRLLASALRLETRHPNRVVRRWHERFDVRVSRHLRVFPDARPALAALRAAGFRLGIVSNATRILLARLESLGLRSYFDWVTYSQEVNADKPDPEVFRMALRRAGTDPSDCVFIGDDYECDVIGARRAGIEPILIYREGFARVADCRVIRSLEELTALLGRPRPFAPRIER